MLQLHVHISLFLQSSFSPKHLQIEADIAPCPTTVHFISSTEESNQLSQSTPNWKNLKPILKKTLSDNNVLEQNKTKPLLVADLKTQRYDEPQSSSESAISQSLTELVEDPEIPAHYFSGNKDLENTPDLTLHLSSENKLMTPLLNLFLTVLFCHFHLLPVTTFLM